jgi:hypothetical protein
VIIKRTIIKLALITRILIRNIKPKIASRVIIRETNKRKSIIRSRPPILNKRLLKIRIKALRRS